MLGDGVDRTHPIRTGAFGFANPIRVNVIKGFKGTWAVCVGTTVSAVLPTHAEAITYADRMARS